MFTDKAATIRSMQSYPSGGYTPAGAIIGFRQVDTQRSRPTETAPH
jgi:hypothetical protein